MAMIKCPECGKSISEYSNQCVHCGCPRERFYSDFTQDFTFAERKGGIFITGYLGKCTNVNIPDEYNGKEIIGIGERAFAGSSIDDFSCGKISGVKLPEHLKYIEKEAFAYCKHLTEIILPDTLISIGESAFKYCKSIQNVSIPCGVEKLQRSTFASSGLKSIKLHTKMKEIGDYCFDNTELEEIKLPKSVDVIGGCAFRSTPFLRKKQAENPLVILNNILIVGDSARGDVSMPNGVIKISPLAFMGASITCVKIPKSVKELGWMSFAQCWNLKRVDLENGLVKIDNLAFSSCGNLSSIKIPISVLEMGNNVFQDCSELMIRCETPFIPRGWKSNWTGGDVLCVDLGVGSGRIIY